MSPQQPHGFLCLAAASEVAHATGNATGNVTGITHRCASSHITPSLLSRPCQGIITFP
ncbi:MAG: hypothetical protein KME26_05740 [Oscillatoria princeps RMCB-10]|nr:hypothetical protein [Oscillatoria princeps RMCB-10]